MWVRRFLSFRFFANFCVRHAQSYSRNYTSTTSTVTARKHTNTCPTHTYNQTIITYVNFKHFKQMLLYVAVPLPLYVLKWQCAYLPFGDSSLFLLLIVVLSSNKIKFMKTPSKQKTIQTSVSIIIIIILAEHIFYSSISSNYNSFFSYFFLLLDFWYIDSWDSPGTSVHHRSWQ